MERYICIHGHFYQPPRENPWLEAIEIQDSAYPYHDWNERITIECYAPNAASRILDHQGRIAKVVNNYSGISFNFGPTLLSWLKENAHDTYQAIRQADSESQRKFSGHGSSLAQAYNHMILPLANRRDRYTQILWGIRDFQDRFGRAPEGLWLPETAVDIETLDLLAELGLSFTILAPSQARRVRGIHEREWQDVTGGRIDPSRAYEVQLPSGRRIAAFFYDGPISSGVAFESLLSRGENLFNKLLGAFNDARRWPQLVHIATDGETYGHHQRNGDMALAHALNLIEAAGSVRLTNYGEFLERHPPTAVVEIYENTSWSCAHGIERWRSDCGCRANASSGWNQAWRAPLRAAFDWLRDALTPLYQEHAGLLFRNPWSARDDYISVILDRSPEKIDQFLSRHARHPLNETERVTALSLLELQRHAMLMYTSCGWFFDEVSGIETIQVIQYAARALQLAKEVAGIDIESQFLERLESAKSNLPEHGDGRRIYKKFVKPVMVDLEKVGAHHAIRSLFMPYPATARIFSYKVERETPHISMAGKNKLIVGTLKIASEITRESAVFFYGVLYLGGHSVDCGIRITKTGEKCREFQDKAAGAFNHADYAEVVRLMDQDFGKSGYSLKSLFRDEQRRIVGIILDSTLSEAEAAYRQVYESSASMAHGLNDLGIPLPPALCMGAEIVLNRQLRRAVEYDTLDLLVVRALLDEVDAWHVRLDVEGLRFALKRTFENLAEKLLASPDDLSFLQKLVEVADTAHTLPFEIDFWKTQNAYFALLRSYYPRVLATAAKGDGPAQAWLSHFSSLGEKLHINIEELKKMRKETTASPIIATLAQEIQAQQCIPRATYRLQLNGAFRFADAAALIPYWHDLGVSDLYVSPILQARPGSMHGYDICNYNKLNPDLGDENDLAHLSAELSKRGMGLILDMVPNHMGISDESNTWWMDVLENGPSSPYAPYFDISWDPVKAELKDKVLLPMLEDQYGRVLEDGKLRLVFENGAFFIYYYNSKLPVAPRTYSLLLSHPLRSLTKLMGPDDPSLQELQSVVTALGYLPLRTERNPEKIAERNREKEVIKRRIAALCDRSPEVRKAIEDTVLKFNGVVGDPRSFDSLDELIGMQAYRPAFWRVAAEEINYRRFFDINELAAIRMEDPEVFEAAHGLVLSLLAKGIVTGLRIDHADGLWDPTAYLRQIQYAYLQQAIKLKLPKGIESADAEQSLSEWFAAQSEADRSLTANWPLYVIVEKILLEGESIPQSWATHGTTGYDFLNLANGIFVDVSKREELERSYVDFIGSQRSFATLVNSTKKMIMLVSLASEIYALSNQLNRISERNRRYRDFTLDSLSFAIREVIAALGVYRTYVTGPNAVSQRDRAYIEAAVTEAKKRNPRTAGALFDFVRDTLLLGNLSDFQKSERPHLLNWVMKFQQITGPVMAKGVEDTAFYVFNRLISLNEVGGYPEHYGHSVATFHRHNTEHSVRWPHSMLASSTHDTKRSEDLRARINVLSEMPEEWAQRLGKWREMNASLKTSVDGEPSPDANDEYFFYQTLLGVWPMREPEAKADLSGHELANLGKRMVEYMNKATKEAKVHTSWINPNREYDDAVQDFVLKALNEKIGRPFLEDFLSFQKRIAHYGMFNGLAQLLLKLTSPGVPDIYQGSELWDLRLVDPDNRQPVDYRTRIARLRELKRRLQTEKEEEESMAKGLAQELLETSSDGRIKLFVIYRALNYRRNHPDLFAYGNYVPLDVKGSRDRHVCAFRRELGSSAIVVVVPRLVVGLTDKREQPPLGEKVWKDTWLVLPNGQPGDRYRNVFTGERLSAVKRENSIGLPLSAIFGCFPVSLLENIAP
jgi:(1->4)-alpha-D-glucan 1-alpha-D-glucosylmutase